ncbi:MAG: hypothetical protein ACF8XB_05340 [Planctomycetota bacterium JB042]
MEWLGWGSSFLLVLTIGYQVRTQWRARDNGGVSRLLYVGQLCASTGFLVYSVSLGNWVFTLTNALLLAAAITGLAIHARNARRQRLD